MMAVRLGSLVELSGYCDYPGSPIAALQFSLDSGVTWTTYETAQLQVGQGVNWHLAYKPNKAGYYVMKVRSINSEGIAAVTESVFAFNVA